MGVDKKTIEIMMPQTLIHFLEEDTSTNSSAPYIFLDSPNSSVNSGWTETLRNPQTMFLSYANAEISKRDDECVPSRPVKCPSQTSEKGRLPERVREKSASAHLFLAYASDHSRRSYDQSSNQDASTEELAEAVRRYFDWGQSEQQFEGNCKEVLETEYKVPQFHATFVSKAIQKGAEETAKTRSRDVDKSYCLYASMFERLLSSKERPKSVEGKGDSKGQVTAATDVDSLYSQVQSLKQESQCQQEELEFLRCALRRLILPSRSSGESQGSHGDNPSNRSNQRKADETGRDRTCNIPNEIAIRLNQSNDDTLDEVSRFSNPHEEQEEEEQDAEEYSSVEDYSPVNPKLEEPTNIKQRSISTTSTAQQSRGLQTSHQSPAGDCPGRPLTCVEATMDLVYSLRAKDDFATPYSEMRRGEVHDDRARGIELEMSFKDLDTPLKGVYNGQVNQYEIPHGRGVLRFDNRDLYIGEFRDGEMHGEGTMFCRSKPKLVTLRGVFHRNEYLGRHSVVQLHENTRNTRADD